MKKAFTASRSSTTIRTLSIRLSGMSVDPFVFTALLGKHRITLQDLRKAKRPVVGAEKDAVIEGVQQGLDKRQSHGLRWLPIDP